MLYLQEFMMITISLDLESVGKGKGKGHLPIFIGHENHCRPCGSYQRLSGGERRSNRGRHRDEYQILPPVTSLHST